MINAIHSFAAVCQATDKSIVGGGCLPHTAANNGTLKTIFTIIFVVVGALAFLMIVIGGLRYVAAGGEANKVAEAKRQIMYSLVGLVVAALAASIVNFVIGRT